MTDLHKAAKEALWAFQYHVEQTWPTDRSTAAITALRAALAQQAGSWQDGVLEGHLRERERWLAQEQAEPKGGGNLPPPLPAEPVAWKLWDENPEGGGDWRYYDAKDFKEGIDPMKYFDGLVPLYTAPPQRKPLTEEEIMRAFYAAEKTPMSIRHGLSVVEAARIVEKAHGIGEQP